VTGVGTAPPSLSAVNSARDVIHVTEAMGAGVLQVVAELARAQAAAGERVGVLYVQRRETPAEAELREMFGPDVELLCAGSSSRATNAWRLFAAVQRVLRRDRAAVVHVHSTIAGIIVRAVGWVLGAKRRVVYSPHGFAFLPEDSSSLKQRGVAILEGALAGACAGIVTAGESERGIAERRYGQRTHVLLVENPVSRAVASAVSVDLTRPVVRRRPDLPLVVAIGRIAHQKAPWDFAAVAEQLAGSAEFVWVGDGATSDRDAWLPPNSGVRVTGWLPHNEVLDVLRGARVLLMPSLWEGLPLALAEALCLGVPAVVSNAPGTRDVVDDGRTGFVVRRPSDLADAVARLLHDDALWAAMSAACRQQLERFAPDRYAVQMSQAYDALGVRPARHIWGPPVATDEGQPDGGAL